MPTCTGTRIRCETARPVAARKTGSSTSSLGSALAATEGSLFCLVFDSRLSLCIISPLGEAAGLDQNRLLLFAFVESSFYSITVWSLADLSYTFCSSAADCSSGYL